MAFNDSARDEEHALAISDSDDDIEVEPDDIEVQEYVDEIQAAHDELMRAQRRFNQLVGLDDNGDAIMPDAPPPPPIISEAVEMDGVEQSAPQPEAVSLNGFFQVLGADGFYHQTRYVFTTTTAQAVQLFGRFVSSP